MFDSDTPTGEKRTLVEALAAGDASAVVNLDLPALDTLVTGMVETRASISRLQALEASLMTAVLEVATACAPLRSNASPSASGVRRGDDRELAWREARAEVATALKMSDRTVERRLSAATTLVNDFPETHAALMEGRIDQPRARVIADAGIALPTAEARSDYEGRVLPRAEDLTPGRLRPVCRAAATSIDPDSISVRHERAHASRGLRVIDLDDGMARLHVDASATLVHAIHDRVTQMAKSVHSAARDGGVGTGARDGQSPDRDERTLEQLRCDVLTDLMLTALPSAHGDAEAFEKIHAHVQVTVPIAALHPEGALVRGSSDPAELSGHGPIDDESARILAGAAKGWDRVFTDATTGGPLSVDRYRPSEHLRRVLRARDEHCRFPGCRMPVWRGDLDHTEDAALGGRTAEDNLEHLCRGHHVLKHYSRWTVEQRRAGVLQWTSPTGRTYDDLPSPRVRFEVAHPAAAPSGGDSAWDPSAWMRRAQATSADDPPRHRGSTPTLAPAPTPAPF